MERIEVGSVKKYEIDYGWSVADFWTPVPEEQVIRRFLDRANDCFGIRKSITEDPKVVSVTEEPIPKPWGLLPGASEMLVHNKPFADTIVWDAEGNKIKTEWE